MLPRASLIRFGGAVSAVIDTDIRGRDVLRQMRIFLEHALIQ
jgi:hypothetical protein